MLQLWQAHCKHWNKLSGPPADSKIVLMTSSAWRGSELLPVWSTTPAKGALDKASVAKKIKKSFFFFIQGLKKKCFFFFKPLGTAFFLKKMLKKSLYNQIN